MRLQKLHDVIDPPPDEEGKEVVVDAAKNADAFAELIQCLDDRSLALVMRDAKNKGKEALKILKDHYLSKGKCRIISLYTELTSLIKGEAESVTDYMLRAETAATSLKTSGEVISDSLLIAMILKGLPFEFKPFSTVVTQKDKAHTFSEFKVALRSFEETDKLCREDTKENSVMKMSFKHQNSARGGGSRNGFKGEGVPKTGFKHRSDAGENSAPTCFSCGKHGHKASDCWSKNKSQSRWCEICKNRSHDTKFCRRRRDSAKFVDHSHDSSEHTFAFKVNVDTMVHDVKGLLVDCGATTHILRDESKFVSFDHTFDPQNHFIELADGSRANNIALKKGNAQVSIVDSNGVDREIILENALYVPSFKQDIFSVQAAIDKGASVEFKPDSAELVCLNGVKFDIEKKGRLYFLNNTISSNGTSHTLKDWHKILGHCNGKDVLQLENVVEGMKITSKQDFECGVCVKGKMTQYRNREPDKRADSILQLVHCDLAGPIDPVAKDGFKYALGFVDDYSGLIMVYFLRQKSDTVHATERFLSDCAPYGSVKCLRSDFGGEFTSGAFESLLVKNHIKHEKSAPYSPHQNGTVERSWRSLFEMARCLLLESKLPKLLWSYAVMAAVYTRNRCYNSRLGKTPFEIFTGQKPNISNMHVFGCVCYAYVQNKKKLDARSEKCIFVGYDKGSPAYLVYYPERQAVKRVRCVKFTSTFEHEQNSDGGSTDHEFIPLHDEPLIHVGVREDGVQGEPDIHIDRPENQDVQENQNVIPENDFEGDNVGRYPRRRCNMPKYLEDYVVDDGIDDRVNYAVDYCYAMADIPITHQEAVTSADSNHWQKAMEEEMNALRENETFELTPLPKARKAVGGRWVYNVKINQDGEERYKARFVAKGYSQLPDIDYQETFSPTARITSVRILMQLAVQYNLIVHQMDVKTAYLNAPIDCELYVEQPEGFEKMGKNGEKLFCRLKKSLYGLKQSGRNWNTMLDSYLSAQGFSQSSVDSCVYTRHTERVITVVVVWVDDIIIASNQDSTVTEVKACLSQKFRMTDLGEICWFLGMQFIREGGVIKMNQSRYIEKLLTKFDMQDCKPRSTPCEMGVNKIGEDDVELADIKLYRKIVGSLIYVMTGTRPDLCYIVTKLSQHLSKPTMTHMTMAKHVLRYMKGTVNQGLVFKKSAEPLRLIGYCDADWGMSDDRRSITGYSFQLSKDGPLVSWKSRKQQTVALSTCEAEYMALAAATQEAKFLMQLMESVTDSDLFGCVTLYCDNQGALALAKNPVQHQRSKHIDIRYHFIRDEVQKGTIQLIYVPSEQNVADIFTKPATRVKLEKLFF
jgi:hypothetical protein